MQHSDEPKKKNKRRRELDELEQKTCHRCGVKGGLGPDGCIACGAKP